jgi:hypothetical protein
MATVESRFGGKAQALGVDRPIDKVSEGSPNRPGMAGQRPALDRGQGWNATHGLEVTDWPDRKSKRRPPRPNSVPDSSERLFGPEEKDDVIGRLGSMKLSFGEGQIMGPGGSIFFEGETIAYYVRYCHCVTSVIL